MNARDVISAHTSWRPLLTAVLSTPIGLTPGAGFVRRLSIHRGHAGGRIPHARGDALRRDLLDLGDVTGCEVNVDRCRVLLHPRPMRRAGNRDDVEMCEKPGERQLRRRAAFLRGDLLDPVHELEVLLKVLPLEPGAVLPPVTGGNIRGRSKAARQEPAAQWAVRDERDSKLLAHREELLFGVAGPE